MPELKDTETKNVRVPLWLFRLLKIRAAETDRPMQDVAEDAISQYLGLQPEERTS